MNDHAFILKWATDCLISKGYVLQRSPEFVQKTPWSNVVRFATSEGNFYLKQTPVAISLEPKIIQLLLEQLHANVPIVIEINEDRHCFLMEDAGPTLRQYLKSEFQPALLAQAIKQFTAIQRSTENNIVSFLSLGVPNWQLDKIPKLFNHLINQVDILKSEGITDDELKKLHGLSQHVAEQCELLSQCNIPETLVQPDFNTNNILFDPSSKQMTLIDLGEIVIAHPFFSLHNFLLKATVHYDIKEEDPLYQQLQKSGLENWSESVPNKKLLEAFSISKKLWPIYFALAHYRLMMSVNLEDLKSFYGNRSSQLASRLREYILSI